MKKKSRKNLSYYKESREKLYHQDKSDMEYVDKCPVSGVPTEDCESLVNIYGAEYMRSPETGHIFLKYRAKEKAINDFYINDVTYSTTYTNKETVETRLANIAVPWVKWMIEVYTKEYGHPPKKILDVGSGAGYFVEACRREGLVAEGIELSQSSRQFAIDNWNLEMDGRDFNKVYEEYEGYDVVTFWDF